MNEIELFKRKLSLVELENALRSFEQVDAPVTHNFADGVYVRELLIPKDSLIIGKRHRKETLNIVLKGCLSLYMGEDVPVKRIEAPAIFTSPPFSKKMVYTHEDTIFLNVHPTEERDLDEIERQFIITEEEYNLLLSGEGEKLCLGQQ